MLSVLQQRINRINQLNLLTNYVSEAQTLNTLSSTRPLLAVSNNYSDSQQVNTQNILDMLRSVLR